MDKMNFWDRDEVIERIKQMHRLGGDILHNSFLPQCITTETGQLLLHLPG